jgi:tryptophan-rich sensory protein
MFEFLVSPVWNTIFIFITISVILYYWKPNVMFTHTGEMRSFGIGNEKTCFSFSIVTFTLAMIFYILFTIVMNIWSD